VTESVLLLWMITSESDRKCVAALDDKVHVTALSDKVFAVTDLSDNVIGRHLSDDIYVT
jgi:hypothetical protein